MINGNAVVDEARKWIDAPFRHQGRSRYGIDCVGLIVCVHAALRGSQALSDAPANYTRRPRRGDETLLNEATSRLVKSSKAEIGGVILFRWPSFKTPTHVAICAGDTMIHAYSTTGKVCEVGYRGPWIRLTHSFYRLPEVSYE